MVLSKRTGEIRIQDWIWFLSWYYWIWQHCSTGRFLTSRPGSSSSLICVAVPMKIWIISLQGCITLVYMIFYEILLKKTTPIHWEDVTFIEDGSQDEVVFTDTHSPSESVMGRSVHLEVPRRFSSRRHRASAARSMPPRNKNHMREQMAASTNLTKWSLSLYWGSVLCACHNFYEIYGILPLKTKQLCVE